MQTWRCHTQTCDEIYRQDDNLIFKTGVENDFNYKHIEIEKKTLYAEIYVMKYIKKNFIELNSKNFIYKFKSCEYLLYSDGCDYGHDG